MNDKAAGWGPFKIFSDTMAPKKMKFALQIVRGILTAVADKSAKISPTLRFSFADRISQSIAWQTACVLIEP